MTAAGKVIVITGASSGVGRAAAIALAAQGAEIAVVGRNPERTRAVAAQTGGTAFLTDFDRLDQVRGLAEALLARYDRIDVLANNAGGVISKRRMTQDGFEQTVQSNYLAPFLLTSLLAPRLIHSGARIISTASVANLIGQIRLDDINFEKRPWFGGWQAYGTSKSMTIAFVRELARRTADIGLEAYSFHPGYVATRFGIESPLFTAAAMVRRNGFGISPEMGAVPLIRLASVPDVGEATGTYFDRTNPNRRMHWQTKDASLAARLWQRTEELLNPWLAPL